MKRKMFTKLCAVGCAAALMLSGCGGPAQTTSEETTSQEEKEQEESVSAEDEEDVDSSVDYTPSTGKTSHVDGEGEEINLAFVLYNWTDDQGTYLESYLEYLEENMNISVECVSYSDSVEDMIDVIESLCSKGVDGIAVASDDGFQSWSDICEENEVYYSIMLGCLSDEDDREYAKDLKYYLGSLGTYDYTFLGEAYGDFIAEQGYQNVLIAKPSRGLQDQADQMGDGVIPVLEENNISYNLIESSWGDMFSSVAAELASDSYDAIYCPLSIMSFGLPNIYANNLVGKTVAMGHGTDETMSDVYGSLITMFSDNLTTSVGVNVAMTINAIEGNQYPDYPEGEAVNIQSPTFIIQSEEDFETYTEYVRNYEDPVYYISYTAVEDMIQSYNPEATYNGIKDYIENLSIENLAENAK